MISYIANSISLCLKDWMCFWDQLDNNSCQKTERNIWICSLKLPVVKAPGPWNNLQNNTEKS